MKKLIEFSVGLVMTLFMAFLIVFVVINLTLNCQTWDDSYWTESSSCVTVSQLMGIK